MKLSYIEYLERVEDRLTREIDRMDEAIREMEHWKEPNVIATMIGYRLLKARTLERRGRIRKELDHEYNGGELRERGKPASGAERVPDHIRGESAEREQRPCEAGCAAGIREAVCAGGSAMPVHPGDDAGHRRRGGTAGKADETPAGLKDWQREAWNGPLQRMTI